MIQLQLLHYVHSFTFQPQTPIIHAVLNLRTVWQIVLTLSAGQSGSQGLHWMHPAVSVLPKMLTSPTLHSGCTRAAVGSDPSHVSKQVLPPCSRSLSPHSWVMYSIHPPRKAITLMMPPPLLACSVRVVKTSRQTARHSTSYKEVIQVGRCR